MTRVNPAQGSTENLTSQSLTSVSIQPPSSNPNLSLAHRLLTGMGTGKNPLGCGGPFFIRQHSVSSVPPLHGQGVGHPLGQVLVAQNGASEEKPAQAPMPGGEPILTSGGVPSSGNSNSAGTVVGAPAVPPPATSTLPAIELVTQRTKDSKKLVGTINIGDKRKTLTTEAFRKVILDASHYPLSATYIWVTVLEESKLIGKQGEYYIVYQRTGTPSRHYVIAMRVKEETADRVEIEWYLVKMKRDKQGNFTGPYSADLNKNREDADPDNSEDAVYTPYNHGGWIYDRKAGKITYHLDSDTGGSVPGWMVKKGALLAFPQELLKVKWKIEGKIEGSLD